MKYKLFINNIKEKSSNDLNELSQRICDYQFKHIGKNYYQIVNDKRQIVENHYMWGLTNANIRITKNA